VVKTFDVKDAKTKNITALLKVLDVKDALLMTSSLGVNFLHVCNSDCLNIGLNNLK
jgi:large subunit ribosomal protein L4